MQSGFEVFSFVYPHCSVAYFRFQRPEQSPNQTRCEVLIRFARQILICFLFLVFFRHRRFVLEDLKLLVEQSTASDMNFQSSLFKMQTDQLGFEGFEELFEKEDEDAPEEPSYDSEWRRCEVSNLMMDFSWTLFVSHSSISETIPAYRAASRFCYRCRCNGICWRAESAIEVLRLVRSEMQASDGKADARRW